MFNFFRSLRQHYLYKRYILPYLNPGNLKTLSWNDFGLLRECFENNISSEAQPLIFNIFKVLKDKVVLIIYNTPEPGSNSVYFNVVSLPRVSSVKESLVSGYNHFYTNPKKKDLWFKKSDDSIIDELVNSMSKMRAEINEKESKTEEKVDAGL